MAGIHGFSLERADGSTLNLADYAGKVLLIVNVASKCGLTPQYEGLEALHKRFADEDFEIIGCPANDFGAQEPGTNAEIQDFCRTSFGVEFPVVAKIVVTGAGKHPLYAQMTGEQPEAQSRADSGFKERMAKHGITAAPGEVMWNFEKFLIGRDGRVAARFTPDTPPEDDLIVTEIRRLLAE